MDRFRKKFLSILTCFALLLNIFSPAIAFAQDEATQSSVVETSTPTPTPDESVSPTPTPTESETVTPIETPTPTILPEITPTPTPASDNDESPTPSEEPVVNGANTDFVAQPNAPPTDTPLPTVSVPSITPVESAVQGHLSIAILHEPSQSDLKLDFSSTEQTSSAALTTDKADYSPTDVAIISGSGLLANTTYILTLSSTDDPATSTTENVTTNDSGNFIYAYQLDGNYRANYKVVLRDSARKIVASTTFTDAASSGVTVTAATGGTNIPSNKAFNALNQYTTLGNIVIAENAKGDFPSPQGVLPNAPVTLILTAPSGWTFKSGTGSTTTTGTDITIVSTTVTSTTITVSFRIAAAQGKNTMTISGIQVQAADKNNVPGSGNILRTSANPGTAAITGVTNNSTNFGSLSQAAVADATNSTVSATPSTVPSDGTSTSTITVTLKDSANNAVSGKTVTLSSSRGATDTISAASGVSSASGIVTFTVKSSTVGNPTFTATDTTDNVVITQTTSVNFASSIVTLTAGTGGSSINADTNTTNGTMNWTSLVGPTLAEGLTGSISTGTIVLNVPTGFVFNTGQAVTVLVTRTAGSGANSRNINGVASGTSLAVTSQSSTQITFTITSATTSEVNNSLTFQNIQVRPTAGNPLASGNITNTGTSTGVPSGANNYGILTEVAGAVSASSSTINASSSSVTVSGSSGSTITVTVKDSFGNPVSGKTVTLSKNNGTNSSISAASGLSASDGTVTFTVIDTTAETVTYTAVADGQTLSNTASVTFTPGAVSALKSQVSAAPSAIPADNMTTSTVTVTLKDAFDNIIPSTSVSLSETSSLSAVISTSPAVTDASGQVSFTVKSSNAGTGTFQATSGATNAGQTTITFTSVTQPTITPQLSSSANSNGWYNSNVTVDWVITDPSHIVTSTNNCGTTSVTTDTSSQVVTCEVTTSLPTTISNSVTIKLDKTKPVITGSKSPTANVNGWNKTDVVVSFSCSDLGSGIDSNTLAGTILSSEGKNQSVTNTGSCIDFAGNTANSATVSGINIDKASPAIASDTPTGTLGNNGWYTSDVTVPFIATDNLSGFDQSNTTSKSLTSKTTSGEGSSLTVLSDTVSDEASNSASAITSDTFSIDKTAPTVASPSATTSVRNNKPTWTWTASSDSGSGLTSTPYTLEWSNDSTFTTGVFTDTSATNSFTHTTSLADGTWYFRVKAIDIAGNSATSASTNITIDTTPVTTSSGSLSTLFSGGYFKSDATSSAALVDTTINLAVSGGTNSISLPAGTVITKTDGSNLDTNDLSASDVSASSLSGLGTGATVNGALQWGIPGIGLTFSQPITLKIFVGTALNGQTLNIVKSNSTSSGWTSSGIVAPATCLVANGLCTFQATSASYYAAVTSTATSTSSTSDGGGGGSVAGSSTDAPSCGAQKPGSAPTLLSATASGTNQVTLSWAKASDPVTYYLITYGTSAGSQAYGNPNVGDQNTTSYTVSNLSGGTTYYFRVRAGNGCKPGDYSNELSATPTGGFVEGPAAGFAAGVLGAKTEAKTSAGEVKADSTESTTPATGETITPTPAISGSASGVKTAAIILLLTLMGGGFLYYFLRKPGNPL